jgi:hypothetical protein
MILGQTGRFVNPKTGYPRQQAGKSVEKKADSGDGISIFAVFD